jgi:hypothetical protein
MYVISLGGMGKLWGGDGEKGGKPIYEFPHVIILFIIAEFLCR